MRKPDPDMLRLTIVRAGGDTGHAVMVGDSMTDVRDRARRRNPGRRGRFRLHRDAARGSSAPTG